MPRIRFVALCVFRHDNRILVGEAFDPTKGETFLRPLGGEVEFGETSADAIVREIREELRAEVHDLTRLGVLENIFTYDGHPGHEVVSVFDGKFVDRALYDLERVPVYEEVWGSEARWVSLASLPPIPLYPDGLVDLVHAAV